MSKKYVKIWQDYHKKNLPKNMEIHHIDGNHANNHPQNLLAVTIEEHLEIHKNQNDHGAVQAILIRMGRTEEHNFLLKESASNHQKNLLNKGIHNFQKISKNERIAISKKIHEKRKMAFLGIEDTIENARNARSNLSREKELEMMKNWHEKINGSFWWNDGKINKRSKDCPGPNFVKGMKK